VPTPRAKRSRILLQGEMPSALNPPAGCRFHTRCPYAVERCRTDVPELHADAATGGHATACHRTAELPPADAVVPRDGQLSPALEKLVAAFGRHEEEAAGPGVGIFDARAPAGI